MPERTAAEIRRELAAEREQLTDAVQTLRAELDLSKALKAKLPALAGAAGGVGFVLAGGVGATMRLLARRGREGHTRANVGPFSVIDRR